MHVEIRPALDSDITGIVDLLKSSLGESLMPKSERYWRWKHVENPFGRSPVLLAVDGDRIVGVRAFMRWTWIGESGRIEAVRAVDTATHPEFQGKGIFSKLTKSLLGSCHEDKIDMVFNTPNNNSKPGYLKMGWIEAGRLPVRIRVLHPLSMVATAVRGLENRAEFQTTAEETVQLLSHPALAHLLAASAIKPLHTAHTPESLRWRYLDVPVAEYRAAGIVSDSELHALYVYRLKPSRLGLEFRVTDVFARDIRSRTELQRNVLRRAQIERADYITQDALRPSLIQGFFSGTSRIGPLVTVRSVASESTTAFVKFTNWSPAIGDLELF
jgi:GNAT superfamily N-acetyltransferase